MTQILGNEKQGLVFEILSARICDEGEERKHVVYTLQVRHISGNDDLSPSVVERRYTHFLNLYSALKKEHPNLMTNVTFPKKVIIGNFDNELISTRSTGFESLLRHICTESKLRASKALVEFLQGVEVEKARTFLEKRDFSSALPLLENNFKLLNKFYTDRSPVVLIALCRLLGCCMSIPECSQCQKWADLALHRYEGVSDSDLLELYVPLLNACITIWWQNGRNKDLLEQRLQDLKRQGVKINPQSTLLDEVKAVEGKIFGL
ncbi:sorting nexin-21 [Tribolium castaneum]|uniref:Sorting nexin-21-like Protein n=1 Tax=Tribolium castaneum TaxID=7070 RepID=D6WL42_TRICA|nr:PREDICTED: sorting nexin-21 [Tribolium castaneum]EFA03513.1 Sorting nexin-21-like Protein [Tribolium castaneum]|eukprot:XP_972525.1 PREDICTED: sorting nexin-21 [Tribolium castaneum]